jgi:NADH-quinone oxidoreductase subunit L
MLGPLVLLAAGSATAGFVKVSDLVWPVFRLPVEHHPHPQWLPFVATGAAVAGIAAAFYLVVMYRDTADRLARSLRGPARVLEAKYGFDLLYDRIASRGIVGGSEKVLWRGVDATMIDGLVNGAGAAVATASRSVRVVQSGLVRAYALLILGGAVAIVAYLLWS